MFFYCDPFVAAAVTIIDAIKKLLKRIHVVCAFPESPLSRNSRWQETTMKVGEIITREVRILA